MNAATTIWFTGLSGAGKSTLAAKLHEYMLEKEMAVQLLDGDIMREELGHLFGYTRPERIKMGNVIRFIAKILNKQGIHVIVAALTPYEEMREQNRKELEHYFEIFVDCPLETCIKRDVKGLYRKALNGELKHFVGVDEVYEVPQAYNLKVNTGSQTIDQSFQIILEALGLEKD